MIGTRYSVLSARYSVLSARWVPRLVVLLLFSTLSSGALGQTFDARDRVPSTEYRIPQSAAGLRSALLYRPEFSTLEARILPSSPDSLERPRKDPWLAFDKAQHLTFSFLWTLGTQYVVVNKGHLSERQALPISITTSAAVGLAKELYDRYYGPTRYFSRRDAVADAVGILLATGIILIE